MQTIQVMLQQMGKKLDDAIMSDNNTDNATTGDGKMDNTTTGETSTVQVPLS